MKKILLAVLILVILVVLIKLNQSYNQRKYKKQSESCEKIQLGITIEDLNKIMEEPEYVYPMNRTNNMVETWFYDIPSGASENVSCRIYKPNGIVIGKGCGDIGFVYFDEDYIVKVGYDSLNTILKNLSSIMIGNNFEEVRLILNKPMLVDSSNSTITWQYPTEWLGFQEPIIIFDATTEKVKEIDVGKEYYIVK